MAHSLLPLPETFLAGHGEICPPHGRSTWRPADQPTTRRSTWTWCFFKENHTRNPCGSACCGLVCGSPCGSPMWGANFAMASQVVMAPKLARCVHKNKSFKTAMAKAPLLSLAHCLGCSVFCSFCLSALPAGSITFPTPKTEKTKVSTSAVAALFLKMALTSQRIAMVDMVFLVFKSFPYLPEGWMESEFASEDFVFFPSARWW